MFTGANKIERMTFALTFSEPCHNDSDGWISRPYLISNGRWNLAHAFTKQADWVLNHKTDVSCQLGSERSADGALLEAKDRSAKIVFQNKVTAYGKPFRRKGFGMLTYGVALVQDNERLRTAVRIGAPLGHFIWELLEPLDYSGYLATSDYRLFPRTTRRTGRYHSASAVMRCWWDGMCRNVTELTGVRLILCRYSEMWFPIQVPFFRRCLLTAFRSSLWMYAILYVICFLVARFVHSSPEVTYRIARAVNLFSVNFIQEFKVFCRSMGIGCCVVFPSSLFAYCSLYAK
jgi:hypothetical protein